ncbi:ferredoxin [Streptomyces sp. NPDC059740]|uniref:ferredoxin n=1 Tax=Streptomyces sp. NPDC059740 TaxID=3346926 RepID=UPI0036501C04
MSTVTWTAEVDGRSCMGSGICAGIAPDLFTLEGVRARPRQGAIEPDERALDAADSCPAMAITVRDGERTLAPRD